MSQIFKEAKRLHNLGFAIIWLHPKSKRPVESGWTTGERKPWEYLKSTYREGMNVGVRTGTPSKFQGKYLAVIDVDIKNGGSKTLERAQKTVARLLADRFQGCPRVRSGRRNGSCHYYMATASPFKMLTVEKDKDLEICIYSDGRQMVLPPSVHPDTGNEYIWARSVDSIDDLPLVDFSDVESIAGKPSTKSKKPLLTSVNDFEVEEVDLEWLPISDKMREGILNGTGVTDRSGFLLPAANSLFSAGLSENEVLSVLTDSGTYLGACAYDHARTTSRKRAAQWVRRYTVDKVKTERDPKAAFADVPITKPKKLSAKEQKEFEAEFVETSEARDWRDKIRRLGKDGDGPPIPTIQNVVLILTGTAGAIVRRDEFAYRDTFTAHAPWGSKKGALIEDDDVALIRLWLGRCWKFEPRKEVIYDALTNIAMDNAFDPVKDRLEQLPPWDGTKRLNSWLRRYFHASGDHDYLAQVFRKWVVAMVARVYRPGLKFDWMPIFEGDQGVGKSSFGRILVGDDYFTDWLPNLADKDAAQALQGIWAVEMGELSQFRRTEMEVVKAFITRTVDKFRPPHGRKVIESRRRCVFFGTTNHEKYLKDQTGNRRLKPVKVGNLEFDQLRKDRDQLFAEAKWLWYNGHETELTLDLVGTAKIYEAEIHAQKMVEDDDVLMFEQIEKFFIDPPKNTVLKIDSKKFRIATLFEVGGPLNRWPPGNKNMQSAAKALKNLNCKRNEVGGYSYWKWRGVGGFDDSE